jgi:hypothetical protein
MTAMTVFNLIASIAVVAGLVAVCRTAHVVAGRTDEETAPAPVEAPRELKRAA